MSLLTFEDYKIGDGASRTAHRAAVERVPQWGHNGRHGTVEQEVRRARTGKAEGLEGRGQSEEVFRRPIMLELRCG